MTAKDPAPIPARIVAHAPVGAVHQPVLVFEGEPPSKGEAVRILLENGVTYATTVAAVIETLDGPRFVTSGLEPVPAP